jgi:hypothetical protein
MRRAAQVGIYRRVEGRRHAITARQDDRSAVSQKASISRWANAGTLLA